MSPLAHSTEAAEPARPRSWAYALSAVGVGYLAYRGWTGRVSLLRISASIAVTYLAVWLAIAALVRTDRRGRVLRIALLFTGGLAVSLGLIESLAAAHVVDYRLMFRTPIFSPIRSPLYIADDDLLYRRTPNSHIHGMTTLSDFQSVFVVPDPHERLYDLKVDDDGFRNDPTPEKLDVALVGDSFVEGAWVSTKEMWSSQLCERIGRPVASYGTIGYGPRRELIVLERYVLPRSPRVVIWAFFEGNDLGNLLLYDQVRPTLAETRAQYHTFWERSFTKNALLALRRLRGRRGRSGHPRSGEVRLHSGAMERTYFLYEAHPLGAEDERALELLGGILAQAHAACKVAGASLIVTFVPTKFRVYQGLTRAEVDAEFNTWRLSDLPDRLRRITSALNPSVPFVDLTSPLRRALERGDPPYFTDDSHWRPVGHGIAASVVAQAIRSMALR